MDYEVSTGSGPGSPRGQPTWGGGRDWSASVRLQPAANDLLDGVQARRLRSSPIPTARGINLTMALTHWQKTSSGGKLWPLPSDLGQKEFH